MCNNLESRIYILCNRKLRSKYKNQCWLLFVVKQQYIPIWYFFHRYICLNFGAMIMMLNFKHMSPRKKEGLFNKKKIGNKDFLKVRNFCNTSCTAPVPSSKSKLPLVATAIKLFLLASHFSANLSIDPWMSDDVDEPDVKDPRKKRCILMRNSIVDIFQLSDE